MFPTFVRSLACNFTVPIEQCNLFTKCKFVIILLLVRILSLALELPSSCLPCHLCFSFNQRFRREVHTNNSDIVWLKQREAAITQR